MPLKQFLRAAVLPDEWSWKNRPETIHFLHVAKAAGTQIGMVIDQINATDQKDRIYKHPHGKRLAGLGANPRYFFSTRDPISRFRSGFYDRIRKSRPRYYTEWTEHEKVAFGRFQHANDLAEALFEESDRGRDATAAIKSIEHTSRNLVDWFDRRGNLFEVAPPIWIIRQERFESDMGIFLERIGFAAKVSLDTDATQAHRNDYSDVRPLSEVAKANLRTWYAQDYAFLHLCEEWLERNAPEGKPEASFFDRSGTTVRAISL